MMQQAEKLVNVLVQMIDSQEGDFLSAEEEILTFVNKLGSLLEQEVLDRLQEPTQENRIVVEGNKAVYKGKRPLVFINRFGEKVRRERRTYANGEGMYYPLDERLGLNRCCGYSPLMSYILALFGSQSPYEQSAEQLSEVLGFSVSATAVQRNTEKTGERIPIHPLRIIGDEQQNTPCELMLVEVDGTLSPQIYEEAGITGRESLKQPTEYKECNVVVIEKYKKKDDAYRRIDRWTGARYGKRELFDHYLHQAGMKMGQMSAEEVVFIADGAKHNWEMQITNFPGACAILDFYHAMEHLDQFCSLLPDEKRAKHYYTRWKKMVYDGDVYQFIAELKRALDSVADRDKAQKEINYFQNNLERMVYDVYRSKGFPIGSGLVEGSCKYVVGKRFKGSGMRWKKADNEAVLRVRLAAINQRLYEEFKPKPRHLSGFSPEILTCQEGGAAA
jgi:hypothetical protein